MIFLYLNIVSAYGGVGQDEASLSWPQQLAAARSLLSLYVEAPFCRMHAGVSLPSDRIDEVLRLSAKSHIVRKQPPDSKGPDISKNIQTYTRETCCLQSVGGEMVGR